MSPKRGRLQNGPKSSVTEFGIVEPRHITRIRVEDDRETRQSRPTGLTGPPASNIETCQRRDSGDSLGEWRGIDFRRHDSRRTSGRATNVDRVRGHRGRRPRPSSEQTKDLFQSLAHGSKLESTKKGFDGRHVGLNVHVREIDVDRRVVAQTHQFEILASQLLVLDQSGFQLRSLFRSVREDSVEITVGGDEFRRRFLSDSRDTGKVVARITAESGVRRILRWSYAGLFQDSRLVVQRVVGHPTLVVENAHSGITNQLVAVAITGDDDDPKPILDRPVGDRGDDVIGLEAGAFDRRYSQGRQNFFHDAHLLAQDLGRFLPLRLVRRLRQMAECWFGSIERDHHAIGTAILQNRQQHRGEPEHRVRDLTRGSHHVGRDSEERSIGQRVSVENQECPFTLRHRHILARIRIGRGFQGNGVRTASVLRSECDRQPRASWTVPSWPCVE